MTKIKLYINRITSKNVYGFIHREIGNRMAVSFSVDDSVYSKLLIAINDSNYVEVDVVAGIIIDILSVDEEKVETLESFILKNIQTKISKKELYEKVNGEFDISYSTFQRNIRLLEKTNSSVRTDYNKIWVV